MAKKRTTLDAVLPRYELQPQAATKSHSPPKEESADQAGIRPNVKQQTLYLRLPVHRQLKVLAFEEDSKMHDLCLEALDMLFANRGLPSIAELINK